MVNVVLSEPLNARNSSMQSDFDDSWPSDKEAFRKLSLEYDEFLENTKQLIECYREKDRRTSDTFQITTNTQTAPIRVISKKPGDLRRSYESLPVGEEEMQNDDSSPPRHQKSVISLRSNATEGLEETDFYARRVSDQIETLESQLQEKQEEWLRRESGVGGSGEQKPVAPLQHSLINVEMQAKELQKQLGDSQETSERVAERMEEKREAGSGVCGTVEQKPQDLHEREVAHLQQSLINAEIQAMELQKQLDDSKETCEKVFAQRMEEVQLLEGRLSGQETLNEELRMETNNMRAECDRRITESAQANTRIIATARESLRDLEEEKGSWKRTLEEYEFENAQAADKVDAQAGEIRRLSLHSSAVERVSEEMERQLAHVKSSYAKLEKTLRQSPIQDVLPAVVEDEVSTNRNEVLDRSSVKIVSIMSPKAGKSSKAQLQRMETLKSERDEAVKNLEDVRKLIEGMTYQANAMPGGYTFYSTQSLEQQTKNITDCLLAQAKEVEELKLSLIKTEKANAALEDTNKLLTESASEMKNDLDRANGDAEHYRDSNKIRGEKLKQLKRVLELWTQHPKQNNPELVRIIQSVSLRNEDVASVAPARIPSMSASEVWESTRTF